jgi:hypothetical protein
MKMFVSIASVVMVLLGTVWFFQGIGVLGTDGEGMTGDQTWAFVGPVFAIAGIALFLWNRKRAAASA